MAEGEVSPKGFSPLDVPAHPQLPETTPETMGFIERQSSIQSTSLDKSECGSNMDAEQDGRTEEQTPHKKEDTTSDLNICLPIIPMTGTGKLRTLTFTLAEILLSEVAL